MISVTTAAICRKQLALFNRSAMDTSHICLIGLRHRYMIFFYKRFIGMAPCTCFGQVSRVNKRTLILYSEDVMCPMTIVTQRDFFYAVFTAFEMNAFFLL